MKTAPEQVIWYKTHKLNETAVRKEMLVEEKKQEKSEKDLGAEKNAKEWAEYYKNYPAAAIAAGYVPPA